MPLRTNPFRAPFPRRLLVRIHLDLLKIDRCVTRWSDYPDHLDMIEIMVLISEDRRFFRHNGVDWWSVGRVLFGTLKFNIHGGASTIDMQFVRTATGFYERSIRRKLYEMLLARIIQYRYSKIQILRSYLSIAFFGSGIYGTDKASIAALGVSKYGVNIVGAAVVASMLVYPRPLVPDQRWLANITRRSNYLLSLYPSLKQRFEKLPRWDAI
ncbi:biosynthetic peptidoglycan transglycosylase [Pleomorphomonas oryzae]|uniref:biosynthetic peptidoglycan transglycosylase n=1 Tax=Pleomorphomonas oryzae TaxID=261934 RepID=UPI000A026E40